MLEEEPGLAEGKGLLEDRSQGRGGQADWRPGEGGGQALERSPVPARRGGDPEMEGSLPTGKSPSGSGRESSQPEPGAQARDLAPQNTKAAWNPPATSHQESLL